MRKWLISICVVGILIFSIFGCGRTTEDTLAAKMRTVKTEDTDTAGAETENVEAENTETESKKMSGEPALEMVEEYPNQEQFVWEDLARKTLTRVCYTDADGNQFYISEEKALQEAAVLLGSLRGVPCTWEPDFYRTNEHDYCMINFTTADEKYEYVVYEGNNLYCDIGDRSFQMQDDFGEVLADLLYFTSTDYLLSLVETEEKRQAIQDILEEEDSRLVRLVVNRLEELNYCLFETSKGQGEVFHLLLWGSWEGKEIQQYQMFLLNDEDEFPGPLEQLSEECEVEKEDIDFDGRPDLLIFEGRSHDVKNGFQHYRVMRWDEMQGQFAYYPSFPFWVTVLNLEDKQVIFRVKGGLRDRTVQIYEVVDGEYRVTQEMNMHDEYIEEASPHQREMISYYENGELMWEYDVTGMTYDEMEGPCREAGLSEIFSYVREYG